MSGKKILDIKELGVTLLSSEFIHTLPISAIAVDESRVYSTAGDGSLVVWDKQSLTHLQTLQVSKQNIPALAIDSDFIFTGGVYDDPVLRIWTKKDMSLITQLEGHTSSILSVFSTKDYLYTGSADGSVIIWRKSDWSQKSSIDAGHEIILSLAVDNDYIYVGGIRNCTNVFTISDNTHVASLKGHDANVFSLANDEDYVYSGSGEIWWGGPGSPRPPSFECAVRVWDKTTWQCMGILSGHTDNVNGLTVDATHVFSVSDDGSLRCFCKKKPSDSKGVQFGSGVINAITSDDATIFIGGAERSVKAIPKHIVT